MFYLKSLFLSLRKGFGLYIALFTFSPLVGFFVFAVLSFRFLYSRSHCQSVIRSQVFPATYMPMNRASKCFSFKGISSIANACIKKSRTACLPVVSFRF